MKSNIYASALIAGLFAGFSPSSVGAQTELTAAREWYAAAEYDRCLNALDSITSSAENTVPAGEYRALCLMALNRDNDAMKAVETIVRKEPLYQPSPSSSPRLKNLVQNVKQSVLPSILQEQYVAAKNDFDAHLYTEAAAKFRTVVALIDDPALKDRDSPLLHDLKMVSGGFLDIIKAAPAPAAAPTPAAAAAALVLAAPRNEPAPAVTRQVPARIYSTSDTDVRPPIALSQDLPAWQPAPGTGGIAFVPSGQVELIIDENGAVESARLIKPIYRSYDDLVLRAAQTWRYRPAQQNGKPVKFRKVIEITLRAR